MAANEDEEKRLRSVAFQNANAIHLARQQAERELATERERLRITLASIGDGVITTDTTGRVVFLNRVAENLTGWIQAEAVGRPLSDVFRILTEHTRQPIESPALRALREGIVVRLANHTVLISRDGIERLIDDSVAPMLDEDGSPFGAVLVFRDVTERKRAEEAVRAAHSWAAAILESITDAFFGLDRNWRFTYVNRQAEQVLGRERRDLIGKILWEEYPGLAGSEFERAYLKAANEKVASSITAYYPDHNRWYEAHSYPSSDGITIYFRDVTQRVAAEQTIVESQESYRRVSAESERRRRLYETALSNTPDLIYVFDLSHRFTYANEALLALWGQSWDEAIGKNCLELGYEPWHAAMHDREIDQVIATRQPIRGEVPFTGTNGRRIYDYIFFPVLGPQGEVEAVTGTTRDVTDRKRNEEAMKEADRRKDEFLALLAHELRNPLAPIRNGLQLLRFADENPVARSKAREMMDRQLTHMVRLVDDLLDVSRITQGKMELRRSRVQLADVVGSAVETASPLVDAARHELAVNLPHEPIVLDGDLIRLAQVFANLLTNSAKYTPSGGKIELAAERRGEEVVVTVRDTGIGIPANELPRIFDMFSQVDRSIEKSTGGLGIGLALVKGLVEMHGGTVTAESKGTNRGSTFTVRLPVLGDHPTAGALPTIAKPATQAGQRVLVVDDNHDGAQSLAEMLSLLGHEAHTAHDGEEAVEAAKRTRPDLILMDVGMPKLNGLEATRRIRAELWGRAITVVALTGWGQDGDRVMSREAGCDGHLVKPVHLPDLEKLLGELRGRGG